MSGWTARVGASAVLLAWSTLGAARADAPHSDLLQRRNPLRSLVPSPIEARERERDHIEHALVEALSLLPEVDQVEVSLSWAPSTGLSLAPAASRAAIVLRVADRELPDEQIRELVRRVAPSVDPHRISIMKIEQPRASATAVPLTSVGPFRVSAASAPGLQFFLAASFIANALLAGAWLARGVLRRRRGGEAGP